MADFSNLEVKDRDTVDYVAYDVVGEPVFIVKRATEANKKYFNEMLRQQDFFQRRKMKVSAEMISAMREKDRELYPKFVITGWRGVKDAKTGVEVPFSVSDCAAYVKQLPRMAFDSMRDFCRDESNFSENVPDAEIISGNSPSV